jgi:hypothetical protein
VNKRAEFVSYIAIASVVFALAFWVMSSNNDTVQAQQTSPNAQQTPSQQQSQEPSQAQPPSQQQPSQSGDQAQQSDSGSGHEFVGTIVKQGDKYKFQEASSGQMYDIDHQAEVSKFDGKKVRVRGTLDPQTKTIHVQ